MKKTRFLTVGLASILLIAPLACRNTDGDGEGEGRGEGEEPGVRLAIDDTYNAVRIKVGIRELEIRELK